MPSATTELILTLLEYALLLGGAFLLFRLVGTAGQRARWLGTNRLPLWPVTLGEFAIFLFLLIGSGAFFQLAAQGLLKDVIARSMDREGLQICVSGFGFHGGSLLGWLLFRSMRKGWYSDYGAQPPAAPPAPALPWSRVLLYGGGALLAALPVVTLINVGWVFLLRRLGLPDEPQDLLAIFENARSPFIVAGLLGVACVVAPLNEELLFRGGLYRFCRQRFGRNTALLLSGCVFGGVHANLASFVPLSVFGLCLALAYESTGDIRVPVVAHGLFNLNTVCILLSGLAQPS